MYLTTYLSLLQSAETALAESHRKVAIGHQLDSDVYYTCQAFARQCDARNAALTPIVERYAHLGEPEPERLHPQGLTVARAGQIGLLRDLQDLYQLANLVDITWTLIGQAARGARDRGLINLATRCNQEIATQVAWLRMRMKAEAPQALLVGF
ncbi:hypothetical protein [Mycobacterium branderi]|uniref:DUF4254 domain-containing protein n=1 Tax=Mycobacterium branderi TaxID=43348 RepID=A0A7I7W0F7_9MYCO|nr:hypothetical protein [Mycobacterium branderi]MCV7233695.1 hypothetical protein [Mycobacterium branderi]ORA38023.1 hypothetical protein BST20_12535 [Mycobacterium branderi]BBZ11049.1 hypothetical protein MBRA_12440 [Mycobacterium branderi]